jgi:hypothetical protein
MDNDETLSDPRWADAGETEIKAENADGVTLTIPKDPANRHYAQLLRNATPIAPYEA